MQVKQINTPLHTPLVTLLMLTLQAHARAVMWYCAAARCEHAEGAGFRVCCFGIALGSHSKLRSAELRACKAATCELLPASLFIGHSTGTLRWCWLRHLLHMPYGKHLVINVTHDGRTAAAPASRQRLPQSQRQDGRVLPALPACFACMLCMLPFHGKAAV
jgi:hypothetical protein